MSLLHGRLAQCRQQPEGGITGYSILQPAPLCYNPAMQRDGQSEAKCTFPASQFKGSSKRDAILNQASQARLPPSLFQRTKLYGEMSKPKKAIPKLPP